MPSSLVPRPVLHPKCVLRPLPCLTLSPSLVPSCTQVLDCVMYSLGLSKHDIRYSLSTMQKMGNMSSGSFLWSYSGLASEGSFKQGEYGVFITMGPGAGVECALWRV